MTSCRCATQTRGWPLFHSKFLKRSNRTEDQERWKSGEFGEKIVRNFEVDELRRDWLAPNDKIVVGALILSLWQYIQ